MDLQGLMDIRNGVQQKIADMATIKVDRNNNYRITVNPDLNRTGDEYFKFYNSATYTNGEKVARILFNEPSYVLHNNGFDAWYPNAKAKRWLMNTMNQTVVAKNGATVSIWEYCIIAFNEERWGLTADETMSNIEENGEKPFQDALAFNLKMPNYMVLDKNTIKNK